VEVGLGLVNLVEGGAQSPLLARIYAIRRQLANQLGYLLPPIKVNDNLNLRHGEYRILLHGAEVSRFEMLPGHELAIPTGAPDHSLPGKPATEPAFGLAAWWIPTSHSDMARRSGYTVIDRISVLGTHLSETIKRHTHELFTRQDAKAFCDRVLPDHPKVVEDLVPKSVSLVTLQKVLQNLLRERVPIRDGVRILEALSEASMTTRNPTLLTEFVRQALRRALVEPFLNAKGELAVYVLSPQLENTLESAVEHAENNSVLTLSPNSLRDVLARISNRIGAKDTSAVLLTNFGARFFLRQIVESNYPNLTVFSHNEIPNPLRLVSLGVIE
jgi:flagellar biosynthesis protein FlhA